MSGEELKYKLQNKIPNTNNKNYRLMNIYILVPKLLPENFISIYIQKLFPVNVSENIALDYL